MKVVLLLVGLALACAHAEWNLNELSPEAGAVEAPRRARKAQNQGYTARYLQGQGDLTMSLTVHKEANLRVTDTDRLLFGIEGAEPEQEADMANMTLTREETAGLCEAALGENWETMVHLPKEDLTYIEALRLAASLNEYTLLKGEHNEGRLRRSSARAPYTGAYDCLCHGTRNKFKYDGYGDTEPHQGPFWGIRVLGKHMYGRAFPKTKNSLGFDCLLCDGLGIGSESTDTENPYNFEYDCRWCCFGKCAVATGGEDMTTSPYAPYVPWCDFNFRYDGLYDSDGTNFFLLNEVGLCRLPKTYSCEDEVNAHCSCEDFIAALYDENGTLVEDCDYCNMVVGANQYICPNCSSALEDIEAFGVAGNFSSGDVCDCRDAMWQVANNYDGSSGGYGSYNDESNDESSYNDESSSYNDENSQPPSYNDAYVNSYDDSYDDGYAAWGNSYSGYGNDDESSYSYSGAYNDIYRDWGTYKK